jgi:hypothetical protein
VALFSCADEVKTEVNSRTDPKIADVIFDIIEG